MTDTEAQKGDAAEEPKTRPPVVQHVSVRSGSVVTGRVESLSAEGRGVFRVGARKVHVRGAWPGDEIEAYVYRRRRGVAEARIERVLEEAIPRREPPCSHIGECGGCIWQQWPVADQLGMKRRLVEKALTEELPGRGVVVDPVRTAGPEFGYRNKMEFSFDQFKESPVKVGLHHAGRYNAVLDVDRCWIAPPEVSEILGTVRTWANEGQLTVYNSRRDEGLLRYLVVRSSARTGEIMLNLVVSDDAVPGLDGLVAEVTSRHPQVASFILGVNTRKGATALAERSRVLHGKETITERIGRFEFEVSPKSFLQTNSAGVEVLYDLIAEKAALTGAERLLDVYCGMGLIGMWMADKAREVVGLEQVPQAVEDANRLRDTVGLDHVRFDAGDAEALLPVYEERGERFDAAVVDPPRAGLHPKALEALLEMRPPCIVYVSCNPTALGRDMARILEAGYEAGPVTPVDMFPHTAHVESVVRLDATN